MQWLPKHNVVVPVDFSPESLAAVRTALDLVPDPTALHVVHVLPVLADFETDTMWANVNNESRMNHALAALRERLAEPRYAGIELAVRFGDPGREVAAWADELKADLIVLPSHGRTGLSRLLIGSVAERVVRLAHCPVLVLKPGSGDAGPA